VSQELTTPPILPKIDIGKIFSTDNGGLALTVEMEQWFYDVVKILNYVTEQIAINDNKTRDELAKLIMIINRQQYPPSRQITNKEDK
jgi:hypothetical protein